MAGWQAASSLEYIWTVPTGDLIGDVSTLHFERRQLLVPPGFLRPGQMYTFELRATDVGYEPGVVQVDVDVGLPPLGGRLVAANHPDPASRLSHAGPGCRSRHVSTSSAPSDTMAHLA